MHNGELDLHDIFFWGGDDEPYEQSGRPWSQICGGGMDWGDWGDIGHSKLVVGALATNGM